MGPLRIRIIAAASVVAVLAAGATGVALADDNGADNTANNANPIESSAAAEQGEGERPALRDGDGVNRGGRHRGHGLGMLGSRGALHGEFVVPDADGGFQTLVSQRVEATAVSATEITVRSEDGFTSTYTITEDTVVNAARDGLDSIEKGTEVHLVGTKDGDTVTALRIGDRSARKVMRERSGLGMDGPGRGA